MPIVPNNPPDAKPCRISGPYHPRGDVDWVCRTHGDVVCEMDNADGFPSRSEMRCPVADPRPGDMPLAYENRSPGGAR